MDGELELVLGDKWVLIYLQDGLAYMGRNSNFFAGRKINMMCIYLSIFLSY